MEKNSEASIERVLSCIEENLFRKPDLNMAAHYSRYHLHRMFTRMTGMPLYSYMERRRLTEAAKLLVYYIPKSLFMTMIQTSITTLLQEKTEPFIQGRIFGLMGSMYAGFLPLGMAIFGPLSDRVSLNGLIFLSGAAYAALSAAVRKWMK